MAIAKWFSILFWTHLPQSLQKWGSDVFSRFFKSPWSKLMIAPYCWFLGLNQKYLSQFVNQQGNRRYSSYHDFFLRQFEKPPAIDGNTVWPCEGYLCDWSDQVYSQRTLVKGKKFLMALIFGSAVDFAPEHSFYNIFLHNHNYHRIHSPVDGTVESVERIAGGLNFLRPWFYKREQTSVPAFINERVVVKIRDENKKLWMMALVGGFGVGTIELGSKATVSSRVFAGEEIGHFALGSTLCLLAPYKSLHEPRYLETVHVGKKLSLVQRTAKVVMPTPSVYLKNPEETSHLNC